jgi:hypothetical protein
VIKDRTSTEFIRGSMRIVRFVRRGRKMKRIQSRFKNKHIHVHISMSMREAMKQDAVLSSSKAGYTNCDYTG